MYGNEQPQGTVRFAFKPQGAVQKVSVAGDFSQWQPRAMRKQKDGTFALIVPGVSKAFQYKFIVDGEWITDPDNSTWAVSPIGTLNSIGSCAGTAPTPPERIWR